MQHIEYTFRSSVGSPLFPGAFHIRLSCRSLAPAYSPLSPSSRQFFVRRARISYALACAVCLRRPLSRSSLSSSSSHLPSLPRFLVPSFRFSTPSPDEMGRSARARNAIKSFSHGRPRRTAPRRATTESIPCLFVSFRSQIPRSSSLRSLPARGLVLIDSRSPIVSDYLSVPS